MQLSISSPGLDLESDEVQRIEQDLEKIERRFRSPEEIMARVKVTNGTPRGFHVLLEVDYKKYHFIAKADDPEVGKAVRGAREDLLQQIENISKRGHSSHAKGS